MPQEVYQRESTEARFWPKVDKTDSCWIWKASLDRHGYGQFRFKGTTHRAHRIAYLLIKGDIPGDLPLDHLCRNIRCVNPDHLEPVTLGENIRRGLSSFYSRERKKAITHCPHGHEYSLENTGIRPNGHRRCRTCDRADCLGRLRRKRAQKQCTSFQEKPPDF